MFGRARKIFFGWWTVLATAIMTAWGYGSWSYGFGAYFKPLMEEFGWTRAQTSAAYSTGTLEGGLEGPLGGWLTDKYGPRIINFSGILLAGIGLIFMYFIYSLWQFILIWGFIVSLGFNLALLGPLETALANWFVKKRGLAVGVSRAGLGFGGAFVPPFMTFLLIQHGWRMAFVIAGLITLTIGMPLTWFFVKPHRPEYYGMLPDGEPVDPEKAKDIRLLMKAGQEYALESSGEIEFTLRQVLKTQTYWIITIPITLRELLWACAKIHQIPHLTDMGVDPVAAAGALGLMLSMSAPGRFIGGILADRISRKRMKYLLIFAFSLQGIGLLILMGARTLGLVYVFTIIQGFGMGVQYSAVPLLRGRYFGRKSFASIQGTDALIRLPVTVFSPIYVGWIYDVTHSYISAFTQSLILVVIAIGILFFLKPPNPPTEITEVTKII